MATWKKIITSGSQAELKTLTLDTALPVAQGGIGATSLTDKAVLISQDSGTDAVGSLAMATNGVILVGGTSGPAVEAASDVAGTGLTAVVGDGTLAINVDAAQTQITSVGTLDGGAISSGFGNIDIGTSTLNAGNTTLDNFTNNSAVADSHFTGSFTGSFTGDGSNLTGVGQDIDTLSNYGAQTIAQTDDHFLISDNGTEKKITFSDLEDSIFANVSGDATIAGGGALTIAANAVEGSMLNSNVAGSGLDYGSDELSVDVSDFMTNGSNNRIVTATGTDAMNAEANLTFDGSTLNVTGDAVVSGDLTVNGDLTTIATTNTKIEDQLMFLGTGSAGTNKDVGIIAQSGSTDLQGSAFYNDTTSERWSVAKSVNQNATAITPLQFVTTVKTDTVNPDTTSGSYGVGEMHVNTSTGEIWIRFG